MFSFAFFGGASSHSSLAPTVEIGGIWPPKGIGVLDPWEISLNTLILPSSGVAITGAHHAILAKKKKQAIYIDPWNANLTKEFKSFQESLFFLVYIKWILHLDKSRDRILERIDRMLVNEKTLSFVNVKLKVHPDSISNHRPLEGLISLLSLVLFIRLPTKELSILDSNSLGLRLRGSLRSRPSKQIF
ncbi:unnamed protein product [Ilex paraguariensis]|uniref:Cytochrome c oxidase subunit 3 n=1 Tax=Ilex paraguariensis TaxID=185542 RepID=A0ABC8RQC9_9AQUA